MATTVVSGSRDAIRSDVSRPALSRRVEQAYQILHVGFTVAPVIAGLDKFFNVLVTWDQYLSPLVPELTGIEPRTFMMIVGVVEIIAGIIVALKPKIGGAIVGLWLLGIVAIS